MQTTRISYGDHPSQWIDLSLPDNPEGRLPVVIFIHGGYWRDEHGADQGKPLIMDLTANGVAAVNVEYRRAGRSRIHGGGGWPATFLDVAAAIDVLADRTDPDRGRLDHDRMVAVGHSAPAPNSPSGPRPARGYRPALRAPTHGSGWPAMSVSRACWT